MEETKYRPIFRAESIERSTMGASVQILGGVIVWYTFSREHDYHWTWHLSLALIILLASFRVALKISNRKKSLEERASYFTMFMVPLLVSSVLWGYQIAYTLLTEGIKSPAGVVICLVAMAMASGISTALAPSPKLRLIYGLMMTLPLLICNAYQATSYFDYILCLCFLILTVFHFVSGRVITKNYFASVRMEFELRAEKEKLQRIVDSFPGFVAVSDYQLNWIEQSKSFDQFKSQPGLSKLRQQFMNSVSANLTTEVEWQHEGLDESFMVSMKRLENPSGAIFVAIPTTELRAIRKQLDAERSQREFSSRLATLGEMAAGVAHEINNPLAIITGNAFQIGKLTETEEIDCDKISQKVESIISTTQRISKIVKSLKSFARQGERDPFTQVELTQVLEDTLQLCQERIRNQGVDLKVDPIPPIAFEARSVQICQVLVNLLGNAFDAIQNQTEMKIRVQFAVAETGRTIAVEDNGPGIPPESQQKIFEPFFTTKEVGKGTGLGLSVSRGIIQEHNGNFRLESVPGKTRFEIELPLKQQNTQQIKSVA